MAPKGSCETVLCNDQCQQDCASPCSRRRRNGKQCRPWDRNIVKRGACSPPTIKAHVERPIVKWYHRLEIRNQGKIHVQYFECDQRGRIAINLQHIVGVAWRREIEKHLTRGR